jgi:hypothetical protein
MNIQLSCPWCQDDVAFTLNERDDEMTCESCGVQFALAPDPVTTFNLLYETAA